MDYQRFVDWLKEYLQTNIGEEGTVEFVTVHKNNNVALDAFRIMFKNSNVAPQVYLNNSYEQYIQGRDLHDIATNLLRTIKESPLNIDISDFTIFENVKENIVFKVVDTERNRELLKECPHVDMNELSLLFIVNCEDFHGGSGTITVNNGLLKQWEITADELKTVALSNMDNMGVRFRSLTSVLNDMMGFDDPEISLIDDGAYFPMYVLTNTSGVNGAAVLFATHNGKSVAEEIAERVGSNYRILPSSIHEVLIVPNTGELEDSYLGNMVKEVNANEVSPEEILSDSPFEFDAETGVLINLETKSEFNLYSFLGVGDNSLDNALKTVFYYNNAPDRMLNKKEKDIKTEEKSKTELGNHKLPGPDLG